MTIAVRSKAFVMSATCDRGGGWCGGRERKELVGSEAVGEAEARERWRRRRWGCGAVLEAGAATLMVGGLSSVRRKRAPQFR